ncbi:hypothetical protein QBC35DRAFT_496498 [Podospora australis]|uniref:Cx9C motif-containing protein 4, mitochondrial n=1 Tax=Podospora australis TaxID=1536484 RepID=A0AAN7AJZ2_9PEZI|nr:hypothetical protein QBC35DRAFT_496498 [Podospora australis]
MMAVDEQDLRSNSPCHPRACAIQNCLTKNGYDEARCTKYIDALYECCTAFYERNGEDATTVSCPKASLLKLKMKQRSQDQRSR